jgi:hypothetical protein
VRAAARIARQCRELAADLTAGRLIVVPEAPAYGQSAP